MHQAKTEKITITNPLQIVMIKVHFKGAERTQIVFLINNNKILIPSNPHNNSNNLKIIYQTKSNQEIKQ
jgi:hypothetical protein